MIDRDVLRQLGWSDRLIDEVTQAAEPLRRSVIPEGISAPVGRTRAVSTTAIYGDTVANNTFCAYPASSQDVPKASTNSAA